MDGDLFGLWPDGYMCPIGELGWEITNGRSDDVEQVIVTEYDEVGLPCKWEPA